MRPIVAIKETRIKSLWTQEKGAWSGGDGTTPAGYYNRKTEQLPCKDLHMLLEQRQDGRTILTFKGGPTGFESYHIDGGFVPRMIVDVHNGRTTLCICAGTINRWPTVTVPLAEVLSFLLDGVAEGMIECTVE